MASGIICLWENQTNHSKMSDEGSI